MFDSILPIGATCNITFLMQNTEIKKQTTLFEWFVCPNLKDITEILYKIGNNQDDNILHEMDTNIYIGDKIYSSHYKLENFKPTYIRRRDRLVDTILLSKKILLCRFETTYIEYKKEDIDNLINSIRNINKNILEVKLLLITPGLELEHPALIKVFYDKHSSDPYCESNEIKVLFLKALYKIGYNINDTVNLSFNDKSEL
jgi:hypothetical protein